MNGPFKYCAVQHPWSLGGAVEVLRNGKSIASFPPYSKGEAEKVVEELNKLEKYVDWVKYRTDEVEREKNKTPKPKRPMVRPMQEEVYEDGKG